MVKLYSEYDRPKLLPFLKSSNNYQLDMALNIVETREFVPEQVYLLGLYRNDPKFLDWQVWANSEDQIRLLLKDCMFWMHKYLVKIVIPYMYSGDMVKFYAEFDRARTSLYVRFLNMH